MEESRNAAPAADDTSRSRPPPELMIRAARPGDAEAIAELINLPKVRWGTLRLPFHTPEEVRKWQEARAPGDLEIVALLEGTLVGQGGLTRRRGRRGHAADLGLAVHDAYHQRGIGTALLQHLLEAADRWLALKRIELEVYTDNAPALALYRRFGFAIEGTHVAYAFRDGALVDAYAMARLVRL